MQSSKVIIENFTQLHTQWEKDSKNIPGHLTVAAKLVEKHNLAENAYKPAFQPADIEAVANSLKNIYASEKIIKIYQKRLAKLNESDPKQASRVNQFKILLEQRLNTIATYLLNLNKAIAQKYKRAFKASRAKDPNKEKSINQAVIYITKTIEVLKTYKSAFDTTQENEVYGLNAEIESYVINPIFKRAREAKDTDIAYATYETIANDAKTRNEFRIQFQAYHEQATLYSNFYKKQTNNFTGQGNINDKRKHVEKISGSFVKAMTVLPSLATSQDPYISKTCKSMHHDFLMLAKQLFGLQNNIKKDWSQKIELLTEAQILISQGESLTYKNEDLITEYTDFKAVLDKEKNSLQTEIDESKKIADDLAAQLEKVQVEEKKYAENFPEILKSFSTQPKDEKPLSNSQVDTSYPGQIYDNESLQPQDPIAEPQIIDKNYLARREAILKQGQLKHTFFGIRLEILESNNIKNKYLTRSISCGDLSKGFFKSSYLDPVEIVNRDKIRNEFGR